MENKILVETSARHIHLTDEALEILGIETLEVKKMLSQPGQFASNTKLDIIGPKKTICGVSVLGPTRDHCQVEVSLTDARTLGVNAPIRESGDIKGSAPIKIINPTNGRTLELSEGLIAAKRHIHMNPLEAKQFKVNNGDKVMVRVNSDERSLIFDDVIIRVNDAFSLAMHIDTDEANAAGLVQSAKGELLCK